MKVQADVSVFMTWLFFVVHRTAQTSKLCKYIYELQGEAQTMKSFQIYFISIHIFTFKASLTFILNIEEMCFHFVHFCKSIFKVTFQYSYTKQS